MRFFAEQCFPEPGSDDLIAATIAGKGRGWIREILIRTGGGGGSPTARSEPGQGEEAYGRSAVRSFVIQGTPTGSTRRRRRALVADP